MRYNHLVTRYRYVSASKTLKLRGTPKAHEYQGQVATFGWPRGKPGGYGENVMRFEPRRQEMDNPDPSFPRRKKEQRLDGGRSEKA
jgi:hypothetical protein